MDYSLTIKQVCEIARAAGEEILKVYDSKMDFQVEAKADNSPLTIADQRANKVICDGLLEITTDIPIMSEENKVIPYETRKDFELYWCVDPLDGTKEFIKRNGEFTVNIALIKENESIAGVVYTPVTDELFYAIKGQGAFLIKNETVCKLEAKHFSMTDEGLRVVCSRSHLNDETQAFIDALSNPKKVAKGSSLKFLILANQGAELYPRLAPTMEWDTAAAQIILEEAGGRVINNNTQESLRYNKEDLRNPHFIAYADLKD